MTRRESFREPRVGSPIILNSTPDEAQKSDAKIPCSNLAYLEQPLLLTIKQAARRMGVKDGQIRKLIRDGRLAHVKVGSRAMIPRGAMNNSSPRTRCSHAKEKFGAPSTVPRKAEMLLHLLD